MICGMRNQLPQHGSVIAGFVIKTILIVLCIGSSSSSNSSTDHPVGVTNSFPLSTRSRWIVDEGSGERVKLRCGNWVGHMEAMLPEGLNKRPLGEIASRIASLGFNCVRLTWPTFMFTNASYGLRTVTDSILGLGLKKTLVEIATHNPWLLDLTVVEAQEAVVNALGKAGVMVVLDNHVSQPQWCCAENDGNGFFGDTYFDPKVWQRGLRIVAARYRGNPAVVGMSLRNELRGPNQNQPGWYQHVKRGVRTIHKANPDVLIIVSGLSYGTDLSFLAHKPLFRFQNYVNKLNNSSSSERRGGVLGPVLQQLQKKLVYEAHWYSFTNGKQEEWNKFSPTWVCANLTGEFDRMIASPVTANDSPLFIGEFGVDQVAGNIGDSHFLTCFKKFAAERDLDWAIWALQATYYRRNGVVDLVETFGVLDSTWFQTKDPNFQTRYRLLEDTLQGAASKSTDQWHYIIYHPSTGLCLQANRDHGTAQMSDCKDRSRWSYGGEETPIKLAGTDLCLRRGGGGDDNKQYSAVLLSSNCADLPSKWNQVPSSFKVQIAATDEAGGLQCLDYANSSTNSSSSVFTRQCVCLEGSICYDPNPQSQWFLLVQSNVS